MRSSSSPAPDRDPLSGTLKLALIPTVGPYLLPHIAAHLKSDLPRLKLLPYEYQTAPLLEKLRAGSSISASLRCPCCRPTASTPLRSTTSRSGWPCPRSTNSPGAARRGSRT